MALLTKREAAERLGVSVDTIDRRLKRGELRGHKEQGPHGVTWMIELPQEGATLGNGGAEPGADTQGIPPADAPGANGGGLPLETLVLILQEQLTAKDQQIDTKDQQIKELHILLQQSQEQASRMLPPPPAHRRWWRLPLFTRREVQT